MLTAKSKTPRSPKAGSVPKAPKAEKPHPAAAIPVTPETPLHGEVITWSMHGQSVPHTTLVAALTSNGLSTRVVREIVPRDAFARACRSFKENRDIRRLEEGEDQLTFQFTQVAKGDEGTFEYALEDMLYLNKHTGEITGAKEDLVNAAAARFLEKMGTRTPGDVTKTIQKLFEEASLFPDPNAKGVYFVPTADKDLLDKTNGFLTTIGGCISRYPVPKGGVGDRAVKITVTEGMGSAIGELKEAVSAFDLGTRAATFEKQAAEIRRTRHKLEVFAEYLGAKREELELALAEAAEELRAKVADAEKAKEESRGPDRPEVPSEIAARRSEAARKANATRKRMREEAEAAAKGGVEASPPPPATDGPAETAADDEEDDSVQIAAARAAWAAMEAGADDDAIQRASAEGEEEELLAYKPAMS